MDKKRKAQLYYGTLAVLIGLSAFQLFTNPHPIGFTWDKPQQIMGVLINYAQDARGYLFQGSPLDVVFAPTIYCDFSLSLAGTTTTNQVIPLYVSSVDKVQPYKIFDIIGNVGNHFQSLTVREQMNCPITASTFPPTLDGGTVSVLWTATKKDGSTIILMQSPGSKIDVSQFNGNVGGKTITLGSWTMTKDDIENKLNVNQGGDSFNSKHNIAVSNQLTFEQGNVKAVKWNCCSSPPMIAYTFQEQVNGLFVSTDGLTLNILSPSDGKINLETSRVVKTESSLPNWTSQQGYPELKLFYTDPSSSTPGSPLLDVQLSPNAASSISSSTLFDFSYAFPKTAKQGQYTFELHQNGRIAVDKKDVFVTDVPINCGDPKVWFFNGATNQCQKVATQTCSDGSVRSASDTCPTPKTGGGTSDNGTNNGGDNQNGDVCTTSQEQLGWTPQTINGKDICLPKGADSYYALIMQNIIPVTVGLIVTIILVEIVLKATKRPPMSPSPYPIMGR